jgi:hypothetical protein
MNLPKLEACGNFVREARTTENLAGFAVAEIPLYAQSDASGIAAEISRRCNEYDELKARVAELEAELLKKHPDTQRMDWLSGGGFALLLIGPDQTIREAIDANRKNGGAA